MLKFPFQRSVSQTQGSGEGTQEQAQAEGVVREGEDAEDALGGDAVQSAVAVLLEWRRLMEEDPRLLVAELRQTADFIEALTGDPLAGVTSEIEAIRQRLEELEKRGDASSTSEEARAPSGEPQVEAKTQSIREKVFSPRPSSSRGRAGGRSLEEILSG